MERKRKRVRGHQEENSNSVRPCDALETILHVIAPRLKGLRTLTHTFLTDVQKASSQTAHNAAINHTSSHFPGSPLSTHSSFFMAEPSNNNQNPSPTALQLAIAVIVLGSSAGFTLYTRKASSMLKTMETIQANQLRNRPKKLGPPTKAEWEKLRPRFDKDEFF